MDHQIYTSATFPDHETTLLFDHVRAQFRIGLSALSELLTFIQLHHTPGCLTKDHHRGIDQLLNNMISMARWLVSFLMTAATCNDEKTILPWAKEAIMGLRVELHQYSWKVMRITKLLASMR